MAVVHEERPNRLDFRLLLFPLILLIALAIFILRLWVLQFVMKDELDERALRLRTTTVSRLAPRGLIVDRQGVPLAGVKETILITCTPKAAKEDPKLLSRLSAILAVPEEKLRKNLDEGYSRPQVPTAVHEGATIEQAIQIVERDDLPGVEVSSQPMRTYRNTKTYAHVMGYVRAPDDRDIKRIKEKGAEAAAYVGKQGLERTHEVDLMGRPGIEEVERDLSNKAVLTKPVRPAVPGKKLILGLDHELQEFAWNLMQGREGSIVAMDPNNGEILCMVSYPSFDASLFQGGLTSAQYKQLQEDPTTPLVNRAVATAVAPGSTFKIVTALARMENGDFRTDRYHFCSGGMKVGNRFIRCTGNHGSVSFNRAMAKSCNAYFMAEALALGPEKLASTAEKLGIGKHTGIDLTGETKGVNPSPEWLAGVRERNPNYRWYAGQTAYFGIGQGEVSATPLQMCRVVATVANRGKVVKPKFVRSVEEPDGSVHRVFPEITGTLSVPVAEWQTLIGSLESVIVSGTATGAQIPGLSWGGKTGSAERKGQAKTDAWFVGFAPLDNPKIAICVRIKGAGHGGAEAAPVAKEIVAKYLKLGAYKPAPPAASNEAASTSDRSASTVRPPAR